MIYVCEMTTRVYVRVKAEDVEQAQDFMDCHSFEDIKQMTSDFQIEYEDNIVDAYDDGEEDFEIDITKRTK